MIESVTQLGHHVDSSTQSWRYVGIELGELFGDSTDPVTIATGAAGAIPYFSRLRTIDTLGLNDRWIARHGVELGGKPGHTKHATMDYLMARGVNLVLEQPYICRPDAPPVKDASFFFQPPIDEGRVPAEARVIEIPLKSGMKVVALYLKPHPYIDDVIVRHGLKVVELNRPYPVPDVTTAGDESRVELWGPTVAPPVQAPRVATVNHRLVRTSGISGGTSRSTATPLARH